MKRRLKATFIVALFVAVVAVPIAFAGGAAEPDPDDPIEITIWFGRADFQPADAFKSFHAENPGIRVTTDVLPMADSLPEFTRAFRAGNEPDILQLNHTEIPPLADAGMLADIQPIIDQWRTEDPEDFNDIADFAWDIASFEGTVHGLGLQSGPFWYIYRKDLFEEAGIPHPPETWDDVLDAARELAGPDMVGFGVIGSRAHAPVWFRQQSVMMGMEHKDAVPQLTSDGGVFLIQFYQTLRRENLAHDDVLAVDAGEKRGTFIGGGSAQGTKGSNIFRSVQDAGLEWNVHWNVPGMPPVAPHMDEPQLAGGGWPYVVSSQTEHMEAVGKVLRYLAETENAMEVAKRYNPTTRMSVYNEPEFLDVQPWYETLREYYPKQIPLPAHAKQGEIDEVLLDVMQHALQNPNENPQEIARQYQAEIDAIVGN